MIAKLPTEWEIIKLSEISERIHYGYTASSTIENTGVKLLRITDIQKNNVFWEDVPFCKIGKADLEKFKLNSGDFVFARTGATVGKSFLITGKIPISVFASYLIRIILQKNINKKYVSYYFQSPQYWTQIGITSVGIGQPNVNANKLSNLDIPIPELDIQNKIVEKIEELFNELDSGVDELRKVREQLKIYRQSVLQAAFTGKLTEEWRKQQNEDWQYGLVADSNKSENSYSQLPEGWKKVKLGNITEKIDKVIKREKKNDEQFLYLDISGIDNQTNKIENHKEYLWKNAPSRAQQIVKLNDILFSTVRTYLRNNALIQNKIYNNQICSTGFTVIRTNKKFANHKYIFNYILSETFVQALNELQTGSSYPAVRDNDVFSQIITLPSLNEQEQIVQEIESRLSIADEVEKTINESLQKAESLKQSILKKAFEGKLI